MRGVSSLAVIAALVSLTACKEKRASPETGMGAGAPLDTVSNPTAPVQVDSAPWEADSAATPSSLTPANRDSVAAADSARADSAKKRRQSSSSPTPKTQPTASAPTPATGDSSAGTATSDTAPASQTASASSGTELRDAYHKAPVDTVDGKTYQGWKYYNLNCARCHGEDVSGTTIAPHLITSLKPDGPVATKELFIQTVCEGRVPKGMPAWCQTGMTPAEIDTIYSYVKGRSEAKLHPGRPARAS